MKLQKPFRLKSMSHSVDRETVNTKDSRVRQNFGRVTRAVLFSSIGFLICIAFQNCSGYSAENSPLYDNQAVDTCVGLTCGVDDTLLRLAIGNDSPVSVKNATVSGTCGTDDSSCVDLGGTCDDGGYPDNYITYQITGGTVQVGDTAAAAKCVNGVFRAQIPLPSNYDFANIHVIRLTIHGIDSSGSAVENSAGGGFREINLASYN